MNAMRRLPWASIVTGATVALAVVAAMLATMTTASAATLDCVDPWGGRYRLPAGASPPSTLLRCTALATAGRVPDAPRSAALGRSAAPSSIAGELVVHSAASGGLMQLLVAPRAAGRSAAPPADLQPLIADAARAYGHDERLLNAIIYVESAFDPRAVSPKGAIGLMQLMPATAQRMGVHDPQRALFDPMANLRAGARYLRKLVDQFSGRPDLAIAAYNAGEGAVQRYGRVPPYPETQEYVRKVMLHAGPAVIR